MLLLQRRFILSGEDLKEAVQDMIVEVVEEMIERFTDERTHYDDWDIAAFTDALWGQFGIRFTFESLPENERTRDGLNEHTRATVQHAYDKKEA